MGRRLEHSMARKPKGRKRERVERAESSESDGGEAAESGMGGDPDKKSLYDLLFVDKAATTSEIKKAYHKLALACHPDKHPDDPEAKDRFQQLQRVKDVLLDEEKRKVYDETGVIMGEDGLGDMQGKSFEELYTYYRAMFQQVTEDEYKAWEAKYPNSAEEREDLTSFYNKYGGSMKMVTECIPFCEKEDLFRVKQVVDKLIADGTLERTAKYDKFKPKELSELQKKVMKAKRAPEEGWEEAKSEAMGKKKGGGEDLFALIKAKQADRENAFGGMIDALAAKYGDKEKAGGKGKKAKARK